MISRLDRSSCILTVADQLQIVSDSVDGVLDRKSSLLVSKLGFTQIILIYENDF